MSNRINLVGLRFGKLTVVAYEETIGKPRQRAAMWRCRCDCGEIAVARSGDLTSGKIKSCGCLQKEQARQRMLKHGYSKTKTYKSWQDMKRRCSSQNSSGYINYGARGIMVCEKWKSFESFFADMGECPEGLTIERIDNNKNYTPENCIWATRKIQNRNSRHNLIIEYQGVSKCLKEWSEVLGINYNTLWYRINKHPPEIAFTI